MAIAMCGDRFDTYAEQAALLAILVETETLHAWPTSKAQEHLREAWGWNGRGIADVDVMDTTKAGSMSIGDGQGRGIET
jgi:hypothetical protein